MGRMLAAGLLILTAPVPVSWLHGQAPQPSDQKAPAFEVASIRITASTVDCAALLANGPPPPEQNGKVPPCAVETHAGRQIIAHGVTLLQFARMLSFPTQSTVVDETGLAGSFDIELEWLPDTDSSPGGDASAGAVSIFTAVQEQLGLKLEPHEGPVDVIVIDHAEKPTPD
jgi:uncharacterized protein (TIGR03435 family)